MTSGIDQEPYPISLIANVLFGISALLDDGRLDDLTFDDVKRHAELGSLIEFLKEKGGGYFASNLFDMTPNFRKWYSKMIADNCWAMDGRERRKYGLENRGVCLLISYTAEIIQTSEVPLTLTNI